MKSSKSSATRSDISLIIAKAPAQAQAGGSGEASPPALAVNALWDAGTRKQFEARFRTALKDREEHGFFFRVHFSEGGFAAFLFVDAGTSTHDLHCLIRSAFGDVAGILDSSSVSDARTALSIDVTDLATDEQKKALQAVSFLLETSRWKATAFGKKGEAHAKTPKAERPAAQILAQSAEVAQAFGEGQLLGEANNRVRTLAMLPTNELAPAQYRAWIQNFAKENGLQHEFWDRRELEKRKAGAFLAVLQADPNTQGGIAHLSYKPAKAAKDGKRVVLVGKGVCFDTGGYNVKMADSMLGMNGDMTGSAIALALIGLFAEQEVDFEVSCYLALAENLISPTAFKPNDVVVAVNGKSIEVIDTDAEGRMLLSDTLAIASREKCDLVIDFATLTYAAMRSLDTRIASVFSNDPKLRELAVQAGERSGERTWAFPIGGDYKKELESKVADLKQCASSLHADHIYAATFLAEFVEPGRRWVHLDLAPAENKGGLGLISTDITGFGVLWAYEMVSAL